jgi:hypothetical protein
VSLMSDDKQAHQRKLYEAGDPGAIMLQAPDLSLWQERVMGMYQRLRTERPYISTGFGAMIGQIPETKIVALLDREGILDDSRREEVNYYFRKMESVEMGEHAKRAKDMSKQAKR